MKDVESEGPEVQPGVQHGGQNVADDDVDWLECISAIETPQGVLYFCDSAYFSQQKFTSDEYSLSTSTQDSPMSSQLGAHQERRISRIRCVPSFVSRFPYGVCLYSITAYNPLNMQQHTVDNHFSNQFLLKDLKEAFPDSEILKNFSYFPSKPHHFERGFTIMIPIRHPSNQEKTIYRLAMKYRQAAYFRCEIEETGEHRQKLVLLLGVKPEVVEESLVVLERLSYHPAYLHPKNNSVFHSFEVAMEILSRCAKLPETQELFQIAKDHVKPGLPAANEPRHPVIVVEGISDAGIGKQSQQLSQSLGAQYLSSPPTCIQHLRKTFDQQNNLIRAAFYYIGNYIVSTQMDEMSKKAPVIVDRYWNSTTAFTIVSEVGNGSSNLPPKEHVVYNWPEDLRKPDAVVLLGSRREIRNSRASSDRCQKELQRRHIYTYARTPLSDGIYSMLLDLNATNDWTRSCARFMQHTLDFAGSLQLWSVNKNHISDQRRRIVETLRRMKSSQWIEVDRCKDQCWSSDALTVVTIDKLRALKLVTLGHRPQDSVCPAATLHPHVEHDVLPVKEYTSDKSGLSKDNIPFL